MFPHRPKKGKNRGADRDIYQKTTAFKSPPSDESRKQRRKPDYFHRPNGEAVAALWSLPEAMLTRSQCEEGAGMAGSVDEAESIDSALQSASGGVSAVWGAGGGLSLGRALGASYAGAE